jgi:hypothetical protein
MNLSRLSPLAISVLTLWGSVAAAEGIKHPFCGTYPGIDLAHLLNAREARERAGLAVRGANVRASSVVSRNGDVAMLIDQGDLLFKANGLDLQGKALEFQPGYSVSRVDRPLNPEGAPIALGDDDSREVPLPFAFPFFGKNYDKAFVNSDGNLTFEAADSASTARTLARLVSGPPRIAPLLADLDPSKAGRVTALSSAASFTVRWTDVPQFDVADKNTFEMTLFPDGRISFSYDAALTLGLAEGAVGISAGSGGEGLTTTNLSDVAGLSFTRSVGESFRLESGIDLSAVARAFYTQFGDDYQQMIVYTNRGFIPPSQSAFAYESTVRNTISGIGGSVFDNGAEYGSAATLESMVMMDRVNKYSTNGTDRVLREETTLSVLAHEVGHRWLATAKFSDGGVASNELLGRQQAHWSFYMHSSGSHDEGNHIDELGAGVFRTGPTSQRYGPLDQYLMGVRTAEEVPPFFFIRSPIADGAQTAERAPESNVDIKGTKKDVTIADVIAAMGPRSPAAAPNGAPWRVAFLYVTEGEAGDAAAVAIVDSIRSQFEEFFQRSTEGRLSIDTRLK